MVSDKCAWSRSSSSSSPLQSQMTFCQCLAQDTADGVGSARSWGLHWGASSHSSRWAMVCIAPQPHVSSVWWFQVFNSALHLPCPTRSLLRDFQVGHGRSCPLASCSVGVIPLSIHSWARVLSWCHSSLQMLVRAVSLVDWRGGTVCRKLALDFSLDGGAVCLCRGCLVSVSCALLSSWAKCA